MSKGPPGQFNVFDNMDMFWSRYVNFKLHLKVKLSFPDAKRYFTEHDKTNCEESYPCCVNFPLFYESLKKGWVLLFLYFQGLKEYPVPSGNLYIFWMDRWTDGSLEHNLVTHIATIYGKQIF